MSISRNTPYEELPTLLSISELMVILGLGKTAVYTAIKKYPLNEYVIDIGTIRINKEFMRHKPTSTNVVHEIQEF